MRRVLALLLCLLLMLPVLAGCGSPISGQPAESQQQNAQSAQTEETPLQTIQTDGASSVYTVNSWYEPYSDLLHKTSYLHFYFLYNLDDDEVPEIFLITGEGMEDSYECSIYTYDVQSHALRLLGELPAGNAVFCGDATNRSVLLQSANMRWEQIVRLQKAGKSIVTETVWDGYSLNYAELEQLEVFTPQNEAGLDWQGNPADENGELLENYISNVAVGEMSPLAAAAYVGVLNAYTQPVVRAAVFDGGGVPMLWVASGNSMGGNVISGNSSDVVYTFIDGVAKESDWFTTLLKNGVDCTAVQVDADSGEDSGNSFRLYHIKDGRVESAPFSTGRLSDNEAVLDGERVGAGKSAFPSLLDLYTLRDKSYKVLLSVYSRAKDELLLEGSRNWYSKNSMINILLAYAGDEAIPVYAEPQQETAAVNKTFTITTPDWPISVYESDSTASEIIDTIPGFKSFVISEVSGKMGKLQSGKGWVDLTEVNINGEDYFYPKAPFSIKTRFDVPIPIYASPSILSTPTDWIINDGTYTIDEVYGDMGRLKSGAGWVDLTTVTVKEN